MKKSRKSKHILGEDMWGYLPPKVQFQEILREGALKKLLRRELGCVLKILMKLPDIFSFFLTISVLLEMRVIKKRFISEQLNDSTLRHSSNHPLINIIE